MKLSREEIHELAFLACHRLNTRDLVTMFTSSENLNEHQLKDIEGYEEFYGFEVIDGCIDDNRREAIYMRYFGDDSNTPVVIEKDCMSTEWKVLSVG